MTKARDLGNLGSDIGTAATEDTGTGATQLPRNSDLGTAAILDTGTAAGQLPTNGNLNQAIGNINNPLLDLPLNNSLAMKQGVGSVTYTCATTSTYVDRYGTLKYAAIDEPRFEKEGLLIEGASTNIVKESEDLSSGYWFSNRATVNTNVRAAPDGTTTVNKIIEDASASNTHYTRSILSGLLATGTTYTGSVFLRAAERTKCQIRFGDINGSDAINVNLATGTITTTGTATGTIVALDDGFYRVSVTVTISAGNNYFYINLADGAGSTYYSGDGVSGIYAWGAQVEELPFASSYIPTSTVAVTRSANYCQLTMENNIPQIGEDFSILVDASTIGRIETSSQYIMRTTTGILFMIFDEGSADTFRTNYSSSTIDATTRLSINTAYRLGMSYAADSNTMSQLKDGSVLATAAPTLTEFPSLGSINIGTTTISTLHLFGHVKNFRIYDRALTASEVNMA